MSHNLKSIYKICLENKFIPEDTTYKQFFETLDEFHKDISYKVNRGYKYRPNERLGVFNIIKDIRKGKTIDWGKSNKVKQSIIDAGGIPYNKETAPEGEMWHIYYEDNSYFKWVWFKEGKAINFIKNIKYYFFRPCTKNRRSIAQAIKEDELVTEIYGVYK